MTLAHRVTLAAPHLHDVLWKFSNLPDYTRLALDTGEEAPEELVPTLVHLTRVARVINVFDSSAIDEIREVIAAGQRTPTRRQTSLRPPAFRPHVSRYST